MWTVKKEDFDRTLKELAAKTSRSLDVFMNSRMLHIAKHARVKTPIASRDKIQTDLGATTRSQKVVKGKIRRRYKYSPTPVVYAIINARRRKAGQPPLERGEMAKAARKLISSRLRAVGSLASGWNRAIGILASAVRTSAGSYGPKVKMQSEATIAKPGFSPTVTMTYRETVQGGGGRQVDPRVVNALDSGFNKEKGEMLNQLSKHINKVAKQSGAI